MSVFLPYCPIHIHKAIFVDMKIKPLYIPTDISQTHEPTIRLASMSPSPVLHFCMTLYYAAYILYCRGIVINDIDIVTCSGVHIIVLR